MRRRRIRTGDTLAFGVRPRFLVRVVEKQSAFWWTCAERYEDEAEPRTANYVPAYLTRRMGPFEILRPE